MREVGCGCEFSTGLFDLCQCGRIGEIKTFGVFTLWFEKCWALWQVSRFCDSTERVGSDGFWRYCFIYNLVHKAGVRTVLKQTAYEVGQQVFVGTDRGVNAAAGAFGLQDDLVQRFAHAVQALEFVVSGGAAHLLGDVEDRSDGVRVMRGKLRIDPVGEAQEFASVADVADIGVDFIGEDGEALHAHDLRPFDFGVPIGAFHKADHDLAVKTNGDVVQGIDDERRALAVGLHDDAKTIPSAQCRLFQDRFDYIKGKCKAISLFRVDVKAHASGLCEHSECADAGHELFHHAGLLRNLIARVQRGKLDRDTRIFGNGAVGAMLCDVGNGAAIRQVIGAGVGVGAGRLAKHIVRIGEANGLHPLGAFHRLVDVLAQHKLTAHLAHGTANGGTDHRLAQTLHSTAQMSCDAGLFVIQNATRQHQGPSGGVHKRRSRVAKVLAPIGRRDLIFDQRVDGFGVWYAQQSLGQTHQGDPLIGGQPIFSEEDLHQARLGTTANLTHQIRTLGRNAGTVVVC